MSTRTRSIITPDWAGRTVEEDQSGWPVIQRFEPVERNFQVGLTDLSHRPKAIVQGPSVKDMGNLKPGQALWTGHAFFACLKQDEGVIFDLTGPMNPTWPDTYHTDITEGWVLLGLFGPRSPEVMQRLVAVDIERPDYNEPFYLVTNAHGMAVRVLNTKGAEPGFLLSCNRSQGQNFFDNCIHTGRHLGLKPVGFELFQTWFRNLTGH